MKKTRIAFVPCDANNDKYFVWLQNSLRKFHTEEELPLIKYDLANVQDPLKWYRATPMIAKDLLKEYETVIKLDADQIITGSLQYLLDDKEEYDVGCVNNSNPREMQTTVVAVWDIHPLQYLNNGFVVMKSEKFVNHWWNLCNSPHFDRYQMKEQDLLNIMCFYGDYNTKLLDSGNKWHGLISKGYWPDIVLKGDSLVLPKNNEWPKDSDKEIIAIHFAGGNDPNKGNYKIRFSEGVVKRLDWLINGKISKTTS